MAGDDAPGKNGPKEPARFYGGPRPIGALLPAVTRPAFRSRAAGAAQLMADWPAIVGPSLAAVSTPRALTRATLTLACAGPVALELQHLAGQLAERINAHYGRTMVEQFRFVQAAATPQAAAAARSRVPPAPPVEVPDMKEGALRDALAALGGAVAQEAKRRPSRRIAAPGLTRRRGSEA